MIALDAFRYFLQVYWGVCVKKSGNTEVDKIYFYTCSSDLQFIDIYRERAKNIVCWNYIDLGVIYYDSKISALGWLC